jgi:hypothetical protein
MSSPVLHTLHCIDGETQTQTQMQQRTHLMRLPATSPSGPPVILIVKGSLERQGERERVRESEGEDKEVKAISTQ